MKPRHLASAPGQVYKKVCAALTAERGVTVGTGRRKGFGSDALTTNGKIFALLSSRRRFVVKLPRARVDALLATGAGERFEPARGRVMKEWLEVTTAHEADWLALAREAQKFVTAST